MALFSYFSSNRSRERTNSKKMDYSGDEYEDADAGTGTALSSIADAFEEISDLIAEQSNADPVVLELKPFCDACSLVSVLFGCLGIAFKFAEMEYTSKVRDLAEASERFVTLSNIVDYDVKWNTVKSPGSLTRNLRRVRQGLDLIRELFQNFLSTNDYSLKDAASSAYQQVCAPYHTWAVRTAVSAGMCALPSRDQLLLNLNETGQSGHVFTYFINSVNHNKSSANLNQIRPQSAMKRVNVCGLTLVNVECVTEESAAVEMRRYIKVSLPVIKYIDNLYVSRGITLDW